MNIYMWCYERCKILSWKKKKKIFIDDSVRTRDVIKKWTLEELHHCKYL